MSGRKAGPANSHAIVVGVESYASGLGSLDGPALDACRFAAWLMRRGLQAANVALFVSPLEKNASVVASFLADLRTSLQLQQGDLEPRRASSSLVRSALVEGLEQRKGALDVLFFYWSGHGVLDGRSSRRLVYDDAHPGELKNLDLNGLQRRLKSDQVPGFDRQIFIIDACALPFAGPTLRLVLVDHELPAGSPDARREQFEMLSSADGQVSANLTGGVFTTELLRELDLLEAATWPPDLDVVARRLIDRFEGLRRKGFVHQAPRFFHYLPWAGLGGELAEAVPNPRFAPKLPSRPRCIGRAAQVDDVVGTLLADDPAPTPILGGPGIGKTTVALEAAHDPRVAARFGSRRFFVRLDSARTADAARAEVAAVLGIAPGPNLAVLVPRELAEAPALLVLDNAETPWWADASACEQLFRELASVPAVALVATIRGTERPWVVSWRSPVVIPPLEREAAKEVFLAVAGEGFRTDAHLAHLLTALDGQSLSITLMAHAAEGEADLEAIWARWQEQGTRMLADAHHTGPLSSVEISFEISISSPRMNDGARRLLSLLGVLPDGIATSDLGTVLPAGAAAWAATLRKAGLATDDRRSARLRTLAPIREHVKASHPPRPDDLARGIAHYSSLAATLGPKVGASGGSEAIQGLASELANVESSLLSGLAGPQPLGMLDAVLAFARFMRFSGLGATHVLDRALELARDGGDVRAEAACLEKLADIWLFRSDHDGARDRYEEALDLCRRSEDIRGEANCLVGLGEIAKRRTDYGAARDEYERALDLYVRAGDSSGQASCALRLGDLALLSQDLEEARTQYDRAQPLFFHLGDILGQANCILRLGDLSLAQKHHDVAQGHYETALALYDQLGATLGEGNCLLNLGEIALELGDQEGARRRYSEALPRFREVGDILGEANSLNSLGHVALASRNSDDARRLYERSLQLYRRIPEPVSIGTSERQLARLAVSVDERRRHARAAREAWATIPRADLVKEIDSEFTELP